LIFYKFWKVSDLFELIQNKYKDKEKATM
jgi:hypothetical protein